MVEIIEILNCNFGENHFSPKIFWHATNQSILFTTLRTIGRRSLLISYGTLTSSKDQRAEKMKRAKDAEKDTGWKLVKVKYWRINILPLLLVTNEI